MKNFKCPGCVANFATIEDLRKHIQNFDTCKTIARVKMTDAGAPPEHFALVFGSSQNKPPKGF